MCLCKHRERKKAFNSFLTKSNTKTLFLSPTTSDEVANILKIFTLNKAIRPNSIPVK